MKYLLFLIFVFSLNLASAEVKILNCIFNDGYELRNTSERVEIDNASNEFLEIDFKNEKIIKARHYDGGLMSKVSFSTRFINWRSGKARGAFDREDGELSLSMDYGHKITTKFYNCEIYNRKF